MSININISGQQIDLGQALQAHVQEFLEKNIIQYLDQSTHISVHFSKEAFLIKCEISVNRGSKDGTIVNAIAVSKEHFQAFQLAVEHLKKQLMKWKDKFKRHHINKEEIHQSFTEATKYILSSSQNEVQEDNPVIIAEKSTRIPYLNVGEAVMRMDLLGLPALMFKNRANERINIVYYREDRNISWIDPKEN